MILNKFHISYIASHENVKINIDSNDDLHLEITLKILNVHNVVIIIHSVFNKSHNRYY